MNKPRIALPIIVEGRYDKNTVKQLFDATVLTTDGFGVFNSREKQALIRRIAEGGVILLTDSDGGGKQIRKFLSGILPPDRIYNAYIPEVEGKEKRKDKPSRAGLLGVEGMSREVLEKILAPFIDTEGRAAHFSKNEGELLTKVDFFTDGLTGAENSSARRDEVARYFGLPGGMTPNALLAALNILTDTEGYREAINRLFSDN